MDSCSAVPMATRFSGHLFGEYFHGESHLSGLMAPQTVTVNIGAPATQTALTVLSVGEHMQRGRPGSVL